jgi:hypothetical protein
VSTQSTFHRRRFLSRVFGAAAAAGLSMSATRAAARESGSDDWINEVKGSHRCLFDFPQHRNGYGLLHILNYLNTYSAAYKTGPGEVGAVRTFYSVGRQRAFRWRSMTPSGPSTSSASTQDSKTQRGGHTRGTCSTGRRPRICTC